MISIEDIVRDRGSRYAVSGGRAANKTDALAFLKALKRKKKFAKASHNSWALVQNDGTVLKHDDGESGAGMLMARMLEREGLLGEVVVVTRWYGGVHLGGDRFRHIQTAVRCYFDHLVTENR